MRSAHATLSRHGATSLMPSKLNTATPNVAMLDHDRERPMRIASAVAFEQSLDTKENVLGPDQSHAVFGAERAAESTMRSARAARQILLHDHRARGIRIEAERRRRRAEDGDNRHAARDRDMHRPAVVGDENFTAVNRRGELA